MLLDLQFWWNSGSGSGPTSAYRWPLEQELAAVRKREQILAEDEEAFLLMLKGS